VAMAARMEAAAGPGLAHVHPTTADRWAAETGRAPPATVEVEWEGGGARAAVYDCAGGEFTRGAGRGAGDVKRLRCLYSAGF
jgi:hypothetical protein